MKFIERPFYRPPIANCCVANLALLIDPTARYIGRLIGIKQVSMQTTNRGGWNTPRTQHWAVRGREETWRLRPSDAAANTYVFARGACTPSRVGTSYSRMQIFSYASTAHRCAPVEADMFPGRLRSHKARDRTPRATAATKAYESCEMTAPLPTLRNPRITRCPERNKRFPASTPTDLATTRKSI